MSICCQNKMRVRMRIECASHQCSAGHVTDDPAPPVADKGCCTEALRSSPALLQHLGEEPNPAASCHCHFKGKTTLGGRHTKC